MVFFSSRESLLFFPFPVGMADIGGTFMRTALLQAQGAEAQRLPDVRVSEGADAALAISSAFAAAEASPRSLLVCAAGPVEGRSVQLTNAAWRIDGPGLTKALQVDQGILLNDFEAQALSLPYLKPEWLRRIGGAKGEVLGPRLAHGPGTGLGTAALIEMDGKFLPLVSEASHSDFAPATEQQRAYWPFITQREGRITPETLISGPGLLRLHAARMALGGGGNAHAVSSQIIAAGCANPESVEAETLREFWRLCARFAGDMALAFMAAGGVFLAGGLLPRMEHLLDEADFRRHFETRAPYTHIASKIPVFLITGKDTVFAGLRALAETPENFALGKARLWRNS